RMRTVRTGATRTGAVRTGAAGPAGRSAAPEAAERQSGGALSQCCPNLRVGGVQEGSLVRIDGHAVLLQAREELLNLLSAIARSTLSGEGATAWRTELRRGAVTRTVVLAAA